jgi:hypothetical protein
MSAPVHGRPTMQRGTAGPQTMAFQVDTVALAPVRGLCWSVERKVWVGVKSDGGLGLPGRAADDGFSSRYRCTGTGERGGAGVWRGRGERGCARV